MYRITPQHFTAIAGVLLLALASILPVAPVFAADLAAHVPGEILIKFTESTSASQKSGALDSFGATVLREDLTLHYSRVRIPDGMTVNEAIDHFNRDSNVKWVEPNYYGWLPGAPQDPHITDDLPPTTPNAWHVFQTNLFHLWRWADGGADTVRIGIIDSGTDLGHADLAGNAAASGHYDFVEGDAIPNDPNGHGTHVAGIACAVSNAVGMAGVAYEAEFVSIRVMNAGGTGTSDNAAQGINWAADSTDVEIINMSIGFPENNVMYEAVANALSAGIIPVAASGNDSASAVGFPANIPGVISVGATASDTTVAAFSNYDSTLDCVAPGVDIWSTKSGGGYEEKSGTSMSSPYVAGIAAIFKNKYRDMTAKEFEHYVSTIAVDLPGVKDGAGLIHFSPLEDWMDAPAAPVASHRNYAYEWLGQIATTELDPNDPADYDGQDNVFLGMYDRDGGDDGVFPQSLPDIPFLPSYMGAPGTATIDLSVSDHTGPRYGGASDLHVDMWIDYNTDFAFTGASEHVIVDHIEDPSTWGSDTKTLSIPLPDYGKHMLGLPMIVRTRVNYGAANPGPGGTADWGEVEDDLMINFFEDFDMSRHGEAPFMGMAGWTLASDAPPCLNRGVYEMARAPHPFVGDHCTGVFEFAYRMPTPTMDFTEYTVATLDFFYCHDVQFPCGPFAMDACRVEYYAGGILMGSDPIPFGGGRFTKDLSFLCGKKDIIIDFVSEADDQGFIGIDDIIIFAFDDEGPIALAPPIIGAAINGTGETTVTLDWTAVDENTSMTPTYNRVANNYEVRFSSTPITSAAEYLASQPVTPHDVIGPYLGVPGAPGAAETVSFRVPTGFGSRYGAVLVGDEVQQFGGPAVSAANPPVATTGVTVTSLNDTCEAAGDTVYLDFTVANTGTSFDTYSLCPVATDTTDWLFLFDDGGFERTKLLLDLAPGTNTVVTMKVWIPFTASAGDTNCVDLEVTSSNDFFTFDKDTGKIIVKQNPTGVAGGESIEPIIPGLAITGSNPFIRNTQVRLSLPKAQPGAVRVYNLAGRMVRTLAEGTLDAGVQNITWDGRNEAGLPVSSGVYLMRLETEKLTDTQRVVRFK